MFLQRHYVDKIPFDISQNSGSQIELYVQGYGSEPRLIFDSHLVEFSPVLPFGDGSEMEVVVANPMPYPVEMYCLEFDKQHLEEEEVGACIIYVTCIMCMHIHTYFNLIPSRFFAG